MEEIIFLRKGRLILFFPESKFENGITFTNNYNKRKTDCLMEPFEHSSNLFS